MPRTLSFPPPSTATCPICSAPLGEPRCGTCGASFSGEDGATLWRVDHDLFDLCRIRNEVVHRLLTVATAGPDPLPAPATWGRPPTPIGLQPHAVTSPSSAPSAPVAGGSPSFVEDRRPEHGTGPLDPVAAVEAPRSAPSTPLPGFRSAPSVEHPVEPPAADSAVPGGPGVWSPASDPVGGPGRASVPPSAGPGGTPPPARRPRPSLTAAEVLVGLGALSLVAAVAVFAAVSWSDLGAWAQGGLIVGLTGVVLAAAVACRRRDLVATSESLGAVGVALGLADVQVARVGLDGAAPDRWVWAVGVAVVAAAAIALGRGSGIRVLGLAGRALAFAPLVVATTGARPLAALSALALQAVVGGTVAGRGADDRAGRVVAVVGTALSGCGAVAGSLALAATGLAADPVAHPVGPAIVLAALAAVSIGAGRRLAEDTPTTADLIGGAGAALALVPAVLLAVGSGAVLPVLAVLAVQGVLAVGGTGGARATRGERAVLAAGGALCWTGATVGSLALALSRLVDGDPVTGPALLLAALALGSIATGRIRSSEQPLAAAGTAVAFVPGLLLAAGTGSVVTVLTVAAVQAVVALAIPGRLTTVEGPVAVIGGWTCWVGAAAGSLLHAAVEVAGATDDPEPRVGALVVLAGLAAASVGEGRSTGRVGLAAAGAGLAFVPVPLAVLGLASPSVPLAVLVGETLVAALLATVVGRGPVRAVLVTGGVTTWAVAVIGAGTLGLAGWLATPVQEPAGAVALLVALAALAVGAALVSGWDTPAAGIGLGAAVVPTLLAVALAAGGLGSEGWVATVLVATAVVAVGMGLLGRVDEGRPWTAPSAVAVAVGAALAVVPARTVLGIAAALVDRAAWAPDAGGGVVVADWLRPALRATDVAVPGWAVVAQLAGAAVLAGAVALLHPRIGRALGALVAVSALVVVPVATGLTVAVTVAGLGLVVGGLAAVVRTRPRDAELLVGAAATVLVGTAFAVGAAPWTVGWTVVVGLLVGALAAEVAARRSPDAPVWAGTAVGVVLAAVGLDAWVLGASGVDGLLAIAVAAAALSPVAALLERRGLDLAADVVDVLVALTLVMAPVVVLTSTGSVSALSPFLAVAGVTAAGAALRPRRRSAWVVATGSAVLLAWVEVGRAEIEVVEAYTLPLAAWALLVGAVLGSDRFGSIGRAAERGSAGRVGLAGPADRVGPGLAGPMAWPGRSLGSWERFGIGLLTAAGPTTVLALVDPDPVRTVAVVVVGTTVAVWGAAARLQAPLAVGAAAVAVLAARHLGPVSVELPRYVTFAVAGLVLLAVGATFEQRRQDLRHARDAFVRLR